MNNHVFIICGIFGVIAFSNGSCAISSESLTDQETVGVIFFQLHHGHPWNAYSHANKGAVGSVRKVLDSSGTSKKYHPSAFRILGYIGDKTDVTRIAHLIEKKTGVLTDVEGKSVVAAFQCLGLMSRRGIIEADLLVNKFIGHGFWKNVKFRWTEESVANPTWPFEYRSIAQVLRGYCLTDKQKLTRILMHLKKLKVAKHIMKNWKAAISDDVLRATKDSIEKKEKFPLSLEHRSGLNDLARKFELLSKNDKDRKALVDSIQSQFSEARKEYEKILGYIRVEKFENASKAILAVEGPFLHTGKDFRIKYELSQIKWLLLKYIDTQKFQYRNLRCKMERSITISELPVPDGSEYFSDIKEKRTLRVQFSLKGSEGFGAIVFKDRLGTPTIEKDGTLRVVMMKTGEKWFWHPFGW